MSLSFVSRAQILRSGRRSDRMSPQTVLRWFRPSGSCTRMASLQIPVLPFASKQVLREWGVTLGGGERGGLLWGVILQLRTNLQQRSLRNLKRRRWPATSK
jgi:hypothetical protein